MDDKTLLEKAAALCERARAISHPMLPKAIKAQIVGAAEILNELVKREVKRGD